MVHDILQVQQQKIEEIRKSLDIVDVIGDYVQLSKQGKEFVGLCPFHSEKSPSFSVNPEKQLYHCFGCGAGGNIFTFLMEIEGMSFAEAADRLADRAKIDLGHFSSTASGRSAPSDQNKKHLAAFELLTKFYHYLLTTAKYGSVGMAYLEKRAFSQEIIERFQIGYAVNSWNAASSLLQRRHVDLSQMAKLGLVASRGFDQKYFDKYRNRIIFPIFNLRGKAIAFAGRTLGDEKPKYLNTPESPIFHKGDILYGYHLARPEIRKRNQVVLLEGYVDVIRAHQFGITWSVASMGTSLTEKQASILKRSAETIVVCYDSDSAGIEAAFRAAGMLSGGSNLIRIARMPEGLDPDDYMIKFGGEQFKSDVIGASQTLMSFKMDYFRRKRNLSDEGDRLLYIEDVLREVSMLKQAVARDHYLRLLADEFSISLDALKVQAKQLQKQLQRKSERKQQREAVQIAQKKQLPPAFEMAERMLLAQMMRSREVTARVQEAIGGNFSVDVHQALAAFLYAFYEEGHEPDEGLFIQGLEDISLQRIAAQISLMPVSPQIDEQEIGDCVSQVLKHSEVLMIEEKERERKQAEESGRFELSAMLLSEIIEMKKALGK
ncbi:DNA primase [Sporolactobacillus spathodeae]|uniref:DNA primase n=1 Tax=Sporolactobacillus spathodeae TaxID=1465502 RepID=A0ABS2Q6H4_9BACL|nr:DNA primase [Sporolactobacillus spathodeae]